MKDKKEDLGQRLRRIEEMKQNESIDKLLEKVKLFSRKANRSYYKPTDYERAQFDEIVKIVNDMANWF